MAPPLSKPCAWRYMRLIVGLFDQAPTAERPCAPPVHGREALRYKIEYLTETTEEGSVCWRDPDLAATLKAAGDKAWEKLTWARINAAARGFQIRDMDRDGEIVALEDCRATDATMDGRRRDH